MPLDLFQTDEYRHLQQEYLYKTIDFLLKNGVEFAVAAQIDAVDFEPPLPEEIRKRLHDVSLFILSGYTYESSFLEKDALRFEAGFGEENYGSWVTIPLLAIKQIYVDEFPIAVNVAETAPESPAPDPSRSMEALLKNPENLKLLKKKKK